MTTPTRDMVLDALLVERIEHRRRERDTSLNAELMDAVFIELDHGDYSQYEEKLRTITASQIRGKEVLRDWRLVQSEVFDDENPDIGEQGRAATPSLAGVQSEWVKVYVGYIPTENRRRYVGLAPRQQED